MNVAGITFRRAFGAMTSKMSSAFVSGAFFALCGVSFVSNIAMNEGTRVSLPTLWAISVSPVLPVLAALLGMGVWSDERASGRIDMLLSSPVKEHDLVVGKFLAVWVAVLLNILFFFAVSFCIFAFFAPSAAANVPLASFAPGIAALFLQASLWSAVTVAASSFCKCSSLAAAISIFVCAVLPRVVWRAMMEFSSDGGRTLGVSFIEAHVYDMSSGIFSSTAVLGYIVLAVLSVFLSAVKISALRFRGRKSFGARFASSAVMILAIALSAGILHNAARFDFSADVSAVGGKAESFSDRTRGILSGVSGDVSATVFMSRKDKRFKSVAHFMRMFSNAAASAGSRMSVRFVDPKWDVGTAGRLVHSGVKEDAIIFERGRRREIVPLEHGFGERMCASAVLRLFVPPQKKNIYWTTGHGEASFDVYGDWGMSELARDLSRDGYRNEKLDLTVRRVIPADCALVVVAGARTAFSKVEEIVLDGYLKQGGRMLVLFAGAKFPGLQPLLASWGLRAEEGTGFAGTGTLTGGDVVVTDFSDHAVTFPLKGSRILLEKPVAFSPSAAAGGSGADKIEFLPLAKAGGHTLAAVCERGSLAKKDLRIRPTRIISVGDSTFAMNGQLDLRANANRDFFFNCIAYLSGTDAITEPDVAFDRFVSGMGRGDFKRLAFVFSGAGMLFAACLAALIAAGRRSK